MPVLSPPGRDPLVSRAWAFSPGGLAASPGAGRWASPVHRPYPSLGRCPKPAAAQMPRSGLQSLQWGATAGPRVPCQLVASLPPGIAPLPGSPALSDRLLNKQWQHQLRSHLSHWLLSRPKVELPQLGQHVLPLFKSLVETAPHKWQDWGLRARLPQARLWAG